MKNLVHAEIKKIMSSKIVWMIPAGAFLPPVISALVLLNREGVGWKTYIQTSTDTFNSLIFFIFASIVSFIWAREYEEKMMEITLLYPYPKHQLFLAKLYLAVFIVVLVVFLWGAATLIIGVLCVGTKMDGKTVFNLINMLTPMVIMHSLLIPAAFFVTILSKSILSGTLLGIMQIALFFIFQSGKVIQYIPFCLPSVLLNNLSGYHTIVMDSCVASWSILIAFFIIFLIANICYLNKKWELR